MTAQFPKSLTENFSIQSVGEETLIYDERRHLAFCLNPIATSVWKLADGRRSVIQIAAAATLAMALPITEELVLLAIEQLRDDGLMIAAAQASSSSSISRRSMLARAGASATLLLPFVAMIAAPKAAQAYNGCVDCSPVPFGQQQGEPTSTPHERQSAGPQSR